MSLNNILKRKPEIVIVDELAHTNVPGSHNRKRYQDVLELLDAGINVIGAFNVQHLESLKDIVERVTGVAIRETVPDSFLKQADQVVNLDLSVEDLQERLRAGKIYGADKIGWALEHFFQDANLGHLRELALREVAESVERSSARRPVDRHPRRRPRARWPQHARDGLLVVGVASRRDAGAQGLAPGWAPEHRLVRRLRRDAAGSPGPHRCRGPAAPAGQHRPRARAGRRGRPPARPRAARRGRRTPSWNSRGRTASATSSSGDRTGQLGGSCCARPFRSGSFKNRADWTSMSCRPTRRPARDPAGKADSGPVAAGGGAAAAGRRVRWRDPPAGSPGAADPGRQLPQRARGRAHERRPRPPERRRARRAGRPRRRRPGRHRRERRDLRPRAGRPGGQHHGARRTGGHPRLARRVDRLRSRPAGLPRAGDGAGARRLLLRPAAAPVPPCRGAGGTDPDHQSGRHGPQGRIAPTSAPAASSSW